MSFTPGYVVNEGTQYEFTVSNETISEAVLADDGITESDIAPYCYTALVDSRIKSVFIQSSKNVMAPGFDSWEAENIPYYFVRDTRNIDSNDDINKDDTVYERNFITWNGTIFPGTPQEKQGTFLVMDMADIKRWYVDFNAGMFITDNFASEITESGVTSVFPGYNGTGYTYLSSTINEPVIHSDNNDPMQNPDEDLHIVNVLVINDELWIGQLNPSCHGQADTGNFQSTYNQYVDSYVQGYLNSASLSPPPIIYQRGSDSWAGIAEIKEMGYPDLGSRSTVYKSYVESSDGIIMEINGNSGSTFDVRTDSGSHCKDLNTLLTWQSWCGLKFTYDNVMYKPIIEQGVIVGYTDDMSAESEYDDMTNVTGNNVSPVPPTPPTPPVPGEDEYDDMGLGVGTNVGGLTNYSIMSIRDLATLLADFNEHLETGMSIQNNFVCLYKLGPLASFLCNVSMRAIVMSANAENNFVSVDNYAVVSGQKSEHYFGSYNVPRFTNTFYDFSPYSTYELFIPCCGWVPLPDTVAGRTIDVYLVFDLASCTCKGIVRITGTTIAEVSGVLGSSVPFYMIEHGMERLAQVTAITQTLSSLAVGGVGAASGNAGVAAYGLSQLTQSLNDLNVSGNTNFTAIKGGNGDMSAMGNGEYCTFKATHPVIDEVVDNSLFGHSVGYLCNAIGKLSTFSGFTVCGNPHVTFSASAEEREEIERLLSMGVIL